MKKFLRAILSDKYRTKLQRIQVALKLFYTKDLLKYLGDRGEIGEFSYGKPRVLHWNEKTKLKIGKFCSISDEVTIFLGGNHRVDWLSMYPFSVVCNDWQEAKGIEGHPATKGDVVIGNDVWIGYGATILSGVKIGDGAVVGAYAVVSRDVAPYAIVAGNPAKEIKKRFDDEKIEKLLNMQWWNWPIDRIRANVRYLSSPNLEKIV